MTDQFTALATALADRYTIEHKIGAGGMATVFLAEDLKHHRKVAIKVLRPELSATLGLERFHREIEVAARLQHPHILPLLDSGEADNFLYYVMPYIDGESLREKIVKEGELPIPDAMRIIRDVVDALTEAHQHGVVHRDIKPENIMLRGRHAMVMDFGVAKAVSAATGSEQLTTAGVALGTPTYMAPEQGTADPHLDHRVDIYAVGAVAFELITGRPVFMGTTPQMILSAHVGEAPPPLSKYRDRVPPELESVIMRCLEKKPADRWQSADELLVPLEMLATPTGGMTPAATRPFVIEQRKGLPRAVPITLAIALVIAVVLLVMPRRDQTPALTLGLATAVTSEEGLEIHPAVSPDGNLVAFAGGSPTRVQVFVRPVEGGRTIPLTDDTVSLQMHPRWSPDGSEILFVSDTSLQVAPALGGRQQTVVPTNGQEIETADWSPDGSQVVFTRGDSIHVVTLATNQMRAVAPDSADLHSCVWSPVDPILACVAGNYGNVGVTQTNYGNLAPSRIVLVSMETGAYRSVTDGTSMDQSPGWGPNGRVLYFVSNRQGQRDIYATSISRDMDSGESARLTTGLDAQSVHISRDGRRLAYSDYTARANLWSIPIPSDGPVSLGNATALTTGNQIIETMMISYDREWLVYDSDLRGNADIYRIAAEGGAPEQLTHSRFDEFAGGLSPDGTELTYHTWESGTRDIAVLTLTGESSTFVTATPGQESYPYWSPDGSRILYYDQSDRPMAYVTERTGPGVWKEPVPVFADVVQPVWSWDGQFLAGVVAEEGAVMVKRYPDGEVREVYRPRSEGDPRPRSSVHWSGDGVTLFFKSHDRNGSASLWSIPEQGGTPRMLVTFGDQESARGDFATDGTRFFFTIEDKQSDIWVMEVGDAQR